MFAWYRRRWLELVASIYIYNEHRGYTALDRVLEAVRSRWPDDHAFIAEIEQHRADEEKHYQMFKRWWQKRGLMPIAVDLEQRLGAAFHLGLEDVGRVVGLAAGEAHAVHLVGRRGVEGQQARVDDLAVGDAVVVAPGAVG